ncbi:MAG: CCA tRNA nucleotidyltransferase [Coriobacteriales bacterium]
MQMRDMELSDAVRDLIALLEAAGHECYVVGGCVRDWLLSRPDHDVDLATSATCDEVHRALDGTAFRVFDTGVEHGTVTVVSGTEIVEVTTYRVDGTYSDHRHPDSVAFTTRIEDDLARRDFTINAMAYHPERGLLDPFGGQADLERRVIRCVGDPDERFSEDALRLLRAVRFASQLSCTLEPATSEALFARRAMLVDVSAERVARELCGFACGADIHRALLDYVSVIGVVVPELLPLQGFDQHNRYHAYSLLEHTAIAMSHIAAEPVLRMTMMLHDIGKPETFVLDENGRGHCQGHPEAGARMAERIMKLLRFSREFSNRVVTLVRNHEAGLQATRRNVRRWLGRLGVDTMRDLLQVKRADVSALATPAHEWLPLFDDVEYLMNELLDEHACFSLRDLVIGGDDLKALGMRPGPAMGQLLDRLLDEVIDERVPNERRALEQRARELMRTAE